MGETLLVHSREWGNLGEWDDCFFRMGHPQSLLSTGDKKLRPLRLLYDFLRLGPTPNIGRHRLRKATPGDGMNG